MVKKKKSLKISKIRMVFLIVILLVMFCFLSSFLRKNIICYRGSDGLSYKFFQSSTLLTSDYSDHVYFLHHNREIVFNDSEHLYSYSVFTKNKKVIVDYPSDYYPLKDKYIVALTKDNQLYLIKGRKRTLIAKNVLGLEKYTNQEIIYRTAKGLFHYSLSKKKKVFLKNIYEYEFSDDQKTLLSLSGGILKVYNLKKDKLIYEYKEVDNYYCINKSCTKLYYIKNHQLYKTPSKKMNVDASEVLYLDSKRMVYAYYDGGDSKLYYRYKNHGSVLIDQNTFRYSEVFYRKGMIGFKVNNYYKEVKKNGKKSKVILDGIEKVIGNYKKGYLLVRDGNLYYNDFLIAEDVEIEDIKTYNKNVYYRVRRGKYYQLYCWNGKRKMLLAKKSGSYYVAKNKVYYIDNFHLSYNYGDLYLYNGHKKKLIGKNASYIFTISEEAFA